MSTYRVLQAFLAGICLAAGICATTAQELVVNGDFSRAGDPPPGWVKEKVTAGKGTMRIVDGLLELAPNLSNTPSDKPLGLGQAIDASSMAGKSLTVSASLGLREPATGAVVGLHALRADGSEIGMVHLRRSQPGEGMETKTGTLVIPPGEKPKLLILFAVAEGLGGLAQFSAISVRAGVLPAVEVRTATDTGAYTAKVSVDAATRGRSIPRSLYGVNIEWWRNANGLWDAHADRLRPETLNLAKELRPALIRFPGGFLGDAYNWRDATGPRKKRPELLPNPGSTEKNAPNFGSEELLEFAGAVNADLLLSVNMGSGTSKMAADWVHFMKVAQQGNPGGPKSQWWEMGNELYHKGDASGVSLSPEAYSDKLLSFAREMRSADSRILIGAIAMENYPAFPFNSYHDWNETVLKRTGGEIDFIALHNAYAPVGPDDHAAPRDVYRALLAAPLMVAENLRTVADQIRRYAPPGRAEQIRIAVTEWAPLFHVMPSSAWVDHSKTLGSALYVADVLRVFIQNDRVEAATFFKLNEPSFLGLIGARHGEAAPNASYYAFQLYTEHFGTSLLSSRTEAPTYDSVDAGIVPAMKNVPLLESIASLSADGTRLFVILINKSINQPADVSVNIDGFSAMSGTAHLLTGASADSNTGTELPKVPGIRWAKQVNIDEKARDFDRGAPVEISYSSKPLANAGKPVAYRLPPHSVVSLELRLKH
ncbi:MAG: alpha-L-arabinofuranosidase C-terminal domain-containing protein [Victivallales bacterium]|jgi:alpha-N-arabinofuranosidase